MDLVIFYSPEKCCVTYYINNDSAGYKIEYPFSYIKNITLENPDVLANAEGASQRPGGLLVELNRPPNFFMDSSGSGGFYQCGDFTEDQQASQVLVHHLGGHPKVLSGQLAKLVSLESFQNRLNSFDQNALAVSAPVSPINHRPASQPNHVAHPQMGMFQEPPYGMGMGGMSMGMGMGMGMNPAMRGHKRQRSRSVPAAIDFNMLRNAPMPSFLIQQHHEPPPSFMHNPEIFAPVPQHHATPTSLGPNLTIDTSAGFGMDMRQFPMSATTANSPSEYGTPGFLASGPANETVQAPNFQPTYNIPFLSPMVDTSVSIPPSVSPLSMGHGDPVIADQSPPLTSFHRDDSADFLQMSHEGAVPDEFAMSDLYNKQPMTLPFRAPLEEHPEELDMNNFMSFNTIDPASLSAPEQITMYKAE